VADLEPLAYGELRLMPWEFGRLTPREFRWRLAGYERGWERAAQLVRWIVQKDYKTELTPKFLLEGKPAPPK
jgi:hypothetical protein